MAKILVVNLSAEHGHRTATAEALMVQRTRDLTLLTSATGARTSAETAPKPIHQSCRALKISTWRSRGQWLFTKLREAGFSDREYLQHNLRGTTNAV